MRLESDIYLDDRPPDRRGESRTGVDVIARAHLFEMRPITVNIRDLTAKGFMMEARMDVNVGAILYLQLPGLNLNAAEVAWSSEHYTGCVFLSPLNSAELNCLESSAWRL
ncbi:MAG: hypothetical protein AAFW97_06220 [Pseudomonadota bacterium]